MLSGILRRFGAERLAQDVAEYSLLVALASLVALGVFLAVSGNLQNMWGTAGGTLATSSAVTTNTPASTPAPPPAH
jgi:Flp pilus assembly pilin Flp